MQAAYSCLARDILQPAVSRLLARVLPAVKAAARRRILATTRVFACTIDSTPRMVYELEDNDVRLGGRVAGWAVGLCLLVPWVWGE